ncbi:uncharacterized protein L203_105456 [Cryptococcus depauperatus CBS 7841]|uniref:AP-1 complex subunit sigma-1 n=1 Tax=Cryptococcus depauperatus CBS 7841 TaxID=1295531 RepID=A0AAJ8M2I3_9TREE
MSSRSHLSFRCGSGPPPAREQQKQNRISFRNSTLESAGQAADIFDLYGSEGEQTRESRVPATSQIAFRASPSQRRGDTEVVLDEDQEGWRSRQGGLDETKRRSIGNKQARRRSASRQSTYSENPPDIAITAPSLSRKSTSLREQRLPYTLESQRQSTTSSDPDTRSNMSYRKSMIGSNLSPVDSHNGPHSSTSTSQSGIGTSEGNKSQTSMTGSSRYFGEDEESFHIRSTYARLDIEGVHGDGWDQGVERTRGGPPTTGKRITVHAATKMRDIGEHERRFLAGLDRYGFVDEPHRDRSESRLASIPSSALSKYPRLPNVSPLAGKPPAQPNTTFSPVDELEPIPRPSKNPRFTSEEEAKVKKKEAERVLKWGKMMKVRKRDQGGNIIEWEWSKDGQGTRLPRRVYKGIPDRWRMAAWWTLSEEQAAAWKKKGKGKSPALELAQDYRIDLDVPRTISGHTMFITRYGAGQRNLWHVLHSFSQMCLACGYVQGMGPIAATLLCYFDPERAYTLMVRLHDVYGMHEIFEPGFPGLLEAFYVQERLMEWTMPDLYRTFQRNMISSSAWGTKWYITLFVNTFPFSQQLRIWDVLWMEGRDTIIITSIAILWAFRSILSSSSASFESILSLLSSYFVAQDEDALMRWVRKVLSIRGIRTKMDSWRAEWKEMVKEGTSDGVLLLYKAKEELEKTSNMINYVMLVSRQGKVRLAKWFQTLPPKTKNKIVKDVTQLVLARRTRMCNFLEYKDTKVIYRRYASLFFITSISPSDNELITLEIIHRYVEVLDRYFGNVCELDLIFNFQKAYAVLDELIISGEIQESSKKTVLKIVAQSDAIEEAEVAEDSLARLGSMARQQLG